MVVFAAIRSYVRYIMMALNHSGRTQPVWSDLEIDDRRNRYEIEIDFLYDHLDADVREGMSCFCQSPDDPENPVYVHTGWQSGSLHDESRWH